MENKYLIERIIALMQLASDDVTRPHLCGVALSPGEDNKVLLEATNGHYASREWVSCTPQFIELLKSERKILISLGELPILKIIAKRCQYVSFTIDKDRQILQVNDSHSFNYDLVKFPDLESVYPTKNNYDAEITFNAEYLHDILKALKDKKSKTDAVTLQIKVSKDADGNMTGLESMTPIYVLVGDRQALLMPMRRQ